MTFIPVDYEHKYEFVTAACNVISNHYSLTLPKNDLVNAIKSILTSSDSIKAFNTFDDQCRLYSKYLRIHRAVNNLFLMYKMEFTEEELESTVMFCCQHDEKYIIEKFEQYCQMRSTNGIYHETE